MAAHHSCLSLTHCRLDPLKVLSFAYLQSNDLRGIMVVIAFWKKSDYKL